MKSQQTLQERVRVHRQNVEAGVGSIPVAGIAVSLDEEEQRLQIGERLKIWGQCYKFFTTVSYEFSK